MKIVLVSLFLALAAHGQQQKRIAILNTEDDGEPSIGILEQAHLTAMLRETANNILPKARYGIMTQQSIVDRLGSQEKAAKECRAAVCLADLGRKINADYIAQARIGRFGGNLTIKTELYEVGSSNLIASFTGSSNDVQGLISVLEAKAPALFKGMLSSAPAPAPAPVPAPAPAPAIKVVPANFYTVNLNTKPKGANLSFNGMPSSSCIRTPCKAALSEGNVRIIAALKQYETADTSVYITGNQNININLKPSSGTPVVSNGSFYFDIGMGVLTGSYIRDYEVRNNNGWYSSNDYIHEEKSGGFGYDVGLKIGGGFPKVAYGMFLVGELSTTFVLGTEEDAYGYTENLTTISLMIGPGLILYPVRNLQLGASFGFALLASEYSEVSGTAYNISVAYDFGKRNNGFLIGLKYYNVSGDDSYSGYEMKSSTIGIFAKYAFRKKRAQIVNEERKKPKKQLQVVNEPDPEPDPEPNLETKLEPKMEPAPKPEPAPKFQIDW
jgi:hypothetical protein